MYFLNFAQDIVNMEDEKEQLHKRIDRMQKKVWHSLIHGKTLRHLCKDLKCKS